RLHLSSIKPDAMTLTKSAQLVLEAERSRRSLITDSLESFTRKSANSETATELLTAYSPWVVALNEANDHITVPPEVVEKAADAYTQVGRLLIAKLHWPEDSISVHPQGSASTSTLIRSPFGGEKFDIDAVCEVDISRVDAEDPMGFFQQIGNALEELDAEAKKRCWKIPCTNEPFYLEFTPSVPLATVPQRSNKAISARYKASPHYQATALAVVDKPTEQWKTSNPRGMTNWVDDTAKKRLVVQISMTVLSMEKRADVSPVPHQRVQINDTLRVAIRLFKRHRDMCVKRNIIESEVRPISIIIVTLLTRCYEGLAELGRTFNHPLELLDVLATLLPNMIEKDARGYRVDNPTVEGENFAEKWNHDKGARHDAWTTWCHILSTDLRRILETRDQNEILKVTRDVFGIPPSSSEGSGPSSTGYPLPPKTRPGQGLA
ncbi:hypothetical protein ACSEOF_29255, partial [Pseudomonas aeruginosa]